MKNFGILIAKNRILVIVISIVLLIPSLYSMSVTKVNYDILSYLPKHLDSMKGQQILDQVFSSGTTFYVIMEGTKTPDVLKTKESLKKIDGINYVLWVDDVLSSGIPKDMLPEDIKKIFFSKDSTLMLVKSDFTNPEKIARITKEMRAAAKDNTYICSMAVLLNDTSELVFLETSKYIAASIILAIIILGFTLESTAIPFVMLGAMGMSIIYNMGSNMLMGQISYITKALAAVLQLGVTMDYSIFLFHRYEEERKTVQDKEKAMANAISKTTVSIMGGAATTIAGFASLCAMQLELGADMGIVMVKGVLIGVAVTITLLPALLLTFDDVIYKSRHKIIMPGFAKPSRLIVKNYKLFIAIFIVIMIPALYGNNNAKVYYNLDESLPETMPSVMALEKLKAQYHMTTIHTLILPEDMPSFKVEQLGEELERVDGIDNSIYYEKFIGPAFPSDYVPDEFYKSFHSNEYRLMLLNTGYKSGYVEGNAQLDMIEDIVKKYDKRIVVAGEGALTRDLVYIADIDFKNVNVLSIISIFLIIAVLFTSIIIPVILVATIESAIFINMAVPYYTNTTIPFIASIVIGCIQLGATVDYAILLTGRFREELEISDNKKEAMENALKTTAGSIATSAMTFFSSTVVVGFFSSMGMLRTLCTMISRGALISMLIIIFILPSILIALEGIISVSSLNWRNKRRKVAYDKVQ